MIRIAYTGRTNRPWTLWLGTYRWGTYSRHEDALNEQSRLEAAADTLRVAARVGFPLKTWLSGIKIMGRALRR